MLAQRLAEVEAVQPPPAAVVGEPVWVRPHLDLCEKPLFRAAEDADARGGAVAGEEEVVLLVDQSAGDAGQVRGKRTQVAARRAVEHLHAVSAGVGDIHPRAWTEDVGVVEAWLRPWRDSDEAGADERHGQPFSSARPTSFLHQAYSAS